MADLPLLRPSVPATRLRRVQLVRGRTPSLTAQLVAALLLFYVGLAGLATAPGGAPVGRLSITLAAALAAHAAWRAMARWRRAARPRPALRLISGGRSDRAA